MSQEHPDYLTVTHGMRGYFVVQLSWSDEHGGYYSPWTSGFGSYARPSDAYPEGRAWAEDEGLEFREVDEEEMMASVARSAARSQRLAELRAAGMGAREAWLKMKEGMPS